MDRAQLERMREALRSQAPFLGQLEHLPSGWESWDDIVGGVPKGGITLVTGKPGSGRITWVSRFLAARTALGHPVAWVDGSGQVYPPALAQLGVQLQRLLMVRHVGERSVFALEQLVESGLFAGVVSSGLDRWLTPSRWRRIQAATEGARVATLMVLAETSTFSGAALRVRVQQRVTKDTRRGLLLQIEKDRTGRGTGRHVHVDLPSTSAGILSYTVKRAI
ncbi:MAG: hypothetical protein ACFB9M_11735 [Myxococcota bacterium]